MGVLEFFENHWFSLVVIVITTAIAWFFGHRKPNIRALCYSFPFTEINKELLPRDLPIEFYGKKVNEIFISLIFIWNGGRAPVRINDIFGPTSLKFDVCNDLIYAGILRSTREENKFILELDSRKNHILLNFSFIDQNDGVLICVWHTGNIIKPDILPNIVGIPREVDCRLAGDVSKGITLNEIFNSGTSAAKKLKRATIVTCALFYTIYAALGLQQLIIRNSEQSYSGNVTYLQDVMPWLLIGPGGFVFLIAMLFAWMFRRRFPSKLVL